MFIGRLKTERDKSFIRFEDSQLEISNQLHLSSSGELKMEGYYQKSRNIKKHYDIRWYFQSGSKGEKVKKTFIETWAAGFRPWRCLRVRKRFRTRLAYGIYYR